MGGHRRMLITESVLGSYLACWNASIKAPGNVDYPWGAPEPSPAPDRRFSGDAITGPASGLNTAATNSSQAQVTAWPLRPAA
ncbi:hypothetical protein HaLaN_30188, partial [Haematococcus lacustris]